MNSNWETGSFIPQLIDRNPVPKQLRWLLKVRDRNLRLVPRFPKNRYDAYAPLYHLLPAEVLRTTGLPLLKRGLWPNYEREDFERKLHRKRSKVKVIFVEMPDTVPIYAEDTEVHERILWGDFMALLDAKSGGWPYAYAGAPSV